jgi:hypothetical protein
VTWAIRERGLFAAASLRAHRATPEVHASRPFNHRPIAGFAINLLAPDAVNWCLAEPLIKLKLGVENLLKFMELGHPNCMSISRYASVFDWENSTSSSGISRVVFRRARHCRSA